MLKRDFLTLLTACVFFVLIVKSTSAQEQSVDDLFPRDRVLEVRISLAAEDWDEIRQQSRSLATLLHPSRQFKPIDSPYTYVQASVTIDGVTWPRVGLRKKGFLGSQDMERPSLKIKLNLFDASIHIGGLKNLTLNNNKQDKSLMSQFMGYDLFNIAGSPAPRCAYAKVIVNGKNLGIYSHVERIHKPLLQRDFGNDTGTLYEGSVVDFYEGWDASFERKFGKDKPGRAQINRLIDALKDDDTDLEQIWSLVDEESFYRFWTMEGLLSFWDGYSANRNNFFIYLNPQSQKFHFIPWGADCMFEKYSRLKEDPESPRAVRMQGLLTNRLYQLPVVRARYAQRMQVLLAQYWNEAELLAETERLEAMLEPHLTQEQQDAIDVEAIRTFIRNRRGDLEPEISGADMPMWSHVPEAPPVFDGSIWEEGSFVMAARDGDLAALQEYLDDGIDVNMDTGGGGSALGAAVLTGQVDAMKVLIEHGAVVNVADNNGNTPLHGAAFFGELAAVKILLDAGADLNRRNNKNETPLDSSSAPWNEETKGAVGWIAQIFGLKKDMAVIKSGRPKVVALLQKNGGKRGADLPNSAGVTLWNAAKLGDLEILRTLLEAGADPNQPDDKSVMPLCWAAMAGQDEAVRLLINHGAELNGRNGDGATPLHGAVFFGKRTIVDLLIELGANVQSRNNKDLTALDTIAVGWSEEMQGVVIWIAGYLDLKVDVQRIKNAWPEIATTLRTHSVASRSE